jgi:hypothetical protein
VTYGVESAFGTAATAAGTSQRMRRLQSSLNISKDTFASQEVRPDFQIATARHGGIRVEGGVDGELSLTTWDDWLGALMRNTWSSGATLNQSGHTSVAASGSVFTFGSGSLITAGVKVGDVVRFASIPSGGAPNNAVNFRVTALTATTMTVHPAPTTFTSQTTFTMTVTGRKLSVGTAKTSYTIEEYHTDIDLTRRYLGCRIAGGSFRLPPNGIASASWQVMGQTGSVLTSGSAPYFSAATAAPTTSALTGIEGGLRLGGVEMGAVTSLDFSLSNNLTAQPVIGTPLVPDIYYGLFTASGTLTAYLESESLINAFLNETDVDLVCVCYDDAAAPEGFLAFNFQRIKLNGAQMQIGAGGGVMVTFPFQALLKTGGAGTAFDQSTLVIQRSNS